MADNQNSQQTPDPKNEGRVDGDEMSTAGTVPHQHKQQGDADQNASGNPETVSSTQENMGDGAGIRGEYGNSSQTNGMEGGPESAPDGSPNDNNQSGQ